MLVLADDAPPHGVPVLIRLITPTMTGWFETRVAETRAMRQGPYQLRLVIRDGLPASFFALAAARQNGLN